MSPRRWPARISPPRWTPTPQLASARRDAAKARGQLNALIGLAPQVRLPLVDDAAPAPPDPAALDAAMASLPQRRPDLLALQAGYASQNANLRKAILAAVPAAQPRLQPPARQHRHRQQRCRRHRDRADLQSRPRRHGGAGRHPRTAGAGISRQARPDRRRRRPGQGRPRRRGGRPAAARGRRRRAWRPRRAAPGRPSPAATWTAPPTWRSTRRR